MARIKEVAVLCPACGNEVRVSVSFGQARCAVCGSEFTAALSEPSRDVGEVRVRAVKLAELDFERFAEWLTAAKGYSPSTARSYARLVKRYVVGGEWPRAVIVLDLWREYAAATSELKRKP